MICPHCSTAAKFNWKQTAVITKSEDQTSGTVIAYDTCPSCNNIVAYLLEGNLEFSSFEGHYIEDAAKETLIYPKKSQFQASSGIPSNHLEDYEEAIQVLSVSPKASAALSRRILQSIIREEFEIRERTLAKEIAKFISLEGIPSHITDAVDAIRHIGNLAAHPTKNENTGEIVSVEPGEAEWLIEVIEALFDFTFIQPKKLERRREELNLKLEEIGKPPMKTKN